MLSPKHSTWTSMPTQWPSVHQRVDIHISTDGTLGLCATVISLGAAFAGALWSSAFFLRTWKEVMYT